MVIPIRQNHKLLHRCNKLLIHYFGKILEKMTDMEFGKKLITYLQSGFQLRGLHKITLSLMWKRHMTQPDTTWRYEMRDLKQLGLKGRLSLFLSNFLMNRSFKTWVIDTFSDMKGQEIEKSSVSDTVQYIRKQHDLPLSQCMWMTS